MAIYNTLKNKLIKRLRREVVDITVGATGLTPEQISTVVGAISDIPPAFHTLQWLFC